MKKRFLGAGSPVVVAVFGTGFCVDEAAAAEPPVSLAVGSWAVAAAEPPVSLAVGSWAVAAAEPPVSLAVGSWAEGEQVAEPPAPPTGDELRAALGELLMSSAALRFPDMLGCGLLWVYCWWRTLANLG